MKTTLELTLEVEYEYTPKDDVPGEGESILINAVYLQYINILSCLSEKQIKNLEEQCLAEVREHKDDHKIDDYESRKAEGLTR